MPEDHVAQDSSAVVVVLGRILDKTEAIHVAHKGSPVGSAMLEEKG